MFRKIVSNLAFSPALVGQLGFYAKRLRKEESTRRIGLVFVALALIVQSFAVFTPPESANAANADNIVYSGIRNKADMLAVYDRGADSAGRNDIQQIYSHFGVTRADIANTTMGSYNTNDFNGDIKSLGRSYWNVPYRSAVKVAGTSTTVYTGKFIDDYNIRKIPMPALIGKRASDGKWFAITLECGNLVYVVPPPAPPKPPTPKPEAICSSLTLQQISRTSFNLIAAAKVSNGATIKSYHYVVTKDGKTLTNRVIPTTGLGSQINQGYEAGTYNASVTVQTSLGDITSPNCMKTFTVSAAPVASCTNLKIATINRTTIKLSASAAVANGATISGYTYTIKDAKEAIVATKNISTTANTSSLQQILQKDGKYSAAVTVNTSLGDKTGPDCVQAFTISPEPLCDLTPSLVANSPDCKPCSSDSTLWYKDPSCVAAFELSKSVRNVSQSINDATTTTARPGDQLRYTLTVKNTGKDTGNYVMTDDLADLVEYADIVDLGDGTIVKVDAQSNLAATVATWPTFTNLKPGQIVQRDIIVKMKPTIPAMAANPMNQSYDCRITNSFGNTVNVAVDCPPEKVVEQIVTELPHTGPNENMIFSGAVLAVVVYFYARSRQTSKEIRLIRRDFNAGTI